MLNKNQKGYTLIEMILVISVISLITIAIYVQYSKKLTVTKVKEQIEYIEYISNSLQQIYLTSNDNSTLTTANAILWGAIPDKLKNGINVNNVFGGSININPSPAPIPRYTTLPAYSISLNRISPQACIGLATSDFGQNTPQIFVNGINVKNANNPFSTDNIVVLATACSNDENTIEFRSYIKFPILPQNPNSYNITKINPYYIPTVGDNVTSPAPTCTGGALWTGSFCSCANGQAWSGTTCEAINTSFRSCQHGKSWDKVSQSCQDTPATKPLTSHYVSSSPNIAPTLQNGSVTAPNPVYISGRYVPSLPMTKDATPTAINLQTTTPESGEQVCTSIGGNWDGRKCNVCPSPSESVKDSYGQTLTLMPSPHAAKSFWNGYRCITPGNETIKPAIW